MNKVVLALGGVVVLLVLSTFLFRDSELPEPVSLSDVLQLADTPLYASYRIDGTEVTLNDGRAEEEQAPGSASTKVTTVWREPVTGALLDSEYESAALVLVQDHGGSGTVYYLATAVTDGTGYLGSNAILLGDRIRLIDYSINHGVVTVVYLDRNDGEAMATLPTATTTRHFTLSGLTLQEVGPLQEGESLLVGELVYGHESRTFTPCDETQPYWIHRALFRPSTEHEP
jgi:hypothetical protein